MQRILSLVILLVLTAASASAQSGPPLPSQRDEIAVQPALKRQRAPAQAVIPQPEPPAQDTWSDAERLAALETCVKLLAGVRADIRGISSIRKGKCGDPAMVEVSAIEVPQRISIRPPVQLNCGMVPAVKEWLRDAVIPQSERLLGSPVIQLRRVGGYACRNRNGARTGRLSEHAFGNALDIGAFRLADGRTISLLKHWGATKRDVANAIERVSTQATAAAPVETSSAETVELTAISLPGRNLRRMSRRARRRWRRAESRAKRKAARQTKRRAKRRSKPRRQIRVTPVKATRPARPSNDSAARFLRVLHKQACNTFGTVLGPEANEAHRDHFHLDLAPRRRSNYCR